MLDMGPEYPTIDGNSYATIFLNKRTSFMWIFLHADKKGSIIVKMMRKARAKVGYWLCWMQSDNAKEYDSPE
eukprot:587141-Rhodomonas_salina.1